MKLLFTRLTVLFTCFGLLFTSLYYGANHAGKQYLPEDPENLLLNVAVVSDLHAGDKLNHERSEQLTRLFAGVARTPVPLDALVLPGDITNNATRDEYRCLTAILQRYNHAGNLIAAIGNHDARGDMNKEDLAQNMANYYAFCQILGEKVNKPYWSKNVNGYMFIVLGSETEEKDRAFISDEQLTWLDAQLVAADAAGNPAFIVCHQVIDHTNNVDQSWYYDGSIGERSDEVRDVIRSHTDNGLTVLFISGHLHEPFGEHSFEEPWENLYCLNLPSAQYEEDGPGCTIEAYGDHILIRPRNFISGEWLEETYTIALN